VDAASITNWRPLGLLLVEKGLLTEEELDFALAKQREHGRRIGEILVESGLVSGPALAQVLAEQLGVELSAEEGFGTGLRFQIVRRHEKRPVDLPPENGNGHVAGIAEAAPADEAPADDGSAWHEPGVVALPADPEPVVELEPEPEAIPLETDPRMVELEAECAGQAEAIDHLTAQLVEREAELDGRDAAIEELKAELEALRAALEGAAPAAEAEPEPEPEEPLPAAHVLLAPGPESYSLAELDGPPPAPGQELEHAGARYVVCKVGRSPFPADPRPCAFLERVLAEPESVEGPVEAFTADEPEHDEAEASLTAV